MEPHGCHTRSPSLTLQHELAARQPAKFATEASSSWKTIEFPTFFHIIHSGPNGKVPESKVDQQLALLNAAFNDARIVFVKAGFEYVDNDAWFGLDLGSSQEHEAKLKLCRDPDKSLNFYIADLQRSPPGANGYARQPWEFEEAPQMDGIVVHYAWLPGAPRPFNRGGVAIHETGHWVGLHHTFENGCNPPGDGVDDTPYQAFASNRDCVVRCSCPPDPGPDPIDNFMDYSSDDCRQRFTPGQFWRIREVVLPRYRPWLFK